MNIPSGDDLYVSGFNRDLRDDAISIAKSFTSMMSMASSNHSMLNTKSDSSGSPLGAATAAQTDGPIEVDFYRNPTVLSRMILYNKFSNANKRCRDHPVEASVWVCAKRKSNVVAHQVSPLHGMFDRSRSANTMNTAAQPQNDNNKYSMRQLPIHIACTSLAFAHDDTSRSELEQLIIRLVVTFPEGCGEFDHGGKLPLHEAIWSNASPETTAMLLMASPQSIERRDKFGRTPVELNNRRLGKNKAEIRDMLNLGVAYWDQARQEARLRMKLSVVPLPSDDKSIDSTSVLGTSQVDKETIVTNDSMLLPARPKPHPIKIESEDIVPMAWEQLERRVLLLEQLLAEMYEKNYELAGLVEELKKTKEALSSELVTAKVTAAAARSVSTRSLKSKSPTRSSLGSCPSVAVVPEDDEVSSVKLMEHAERIEQLESLVGSYNSSRRKRRNTGGSKVSELSSFSSHTNDGAFIRDRTHLARQDSLVSGLTDEASLFDTSIHAVKDHLARYEDGLGASGREVSEVLGTDNLNEIFHKAAEMHAAEPIPRKEWAPPIAATSFLPTADNIHAEFPAPMAVEEEEEEEEDETLSGSIMSSSISKMEDSKPPATPVRASEIYFPGFRLEPDTSHVNSTISISASSAESSATSMSENSTIVTDDKEIYFAVRRDSLGSVNDSTVEDEQVSSASKSTRARLEDMVFGSAPDGHEESESSGHQPQRYNYDIRIPALDTYYGSSETGEI